MSRREMVSEREVGRKESPRKNERRGETKRKSAIHRHTEEGPDSQPDRQRGRETETTTKNKKSICVSEPRAICPSRSLARGTEGKSEPFRAVPHTYFYPGGIIPDYQALPSEIHTVYIFFHYRNRKEI